MTRVQAVMAVMAAMNSNRIEDTERQFHPDCVMSKPYGEFAGIDRMWEDWYVAVAVFQSIPYTHTAHTAHSCNSYGLCGRGCQAKPAA